MKVFISHSSTDKRFVQTLKDDLHENGIDTWIDEDQLDLGDSLAEKLEASLEDSSHFLIILSPTSLNSEWVTLELKNALKQRNCDLIQKVIAIKYRGCEVPQELNKLVYADLSNEIRQVSGNKVIFNSDVYLKFLTNLCRAIRNSEKALTELNKSALKQKVVVTSTAGEHNVTRFTKGMYLLKGYKNVETRLSYSKIIISSTSNMTFENINEVRPVLLPPLLKVLFKKLQLGDKIYFSKNYEENEVGHFAGYRNDDLAITLDPRIRQRIKVTKGQTYKIEIDSSKRTITFFDPV